MPTRAASQTALDMVRASTMSAHHAAVAVGQERGIGRRDHRGIGLRRWSKLIKHRRARPVVGSPARQAKQEPDGAQAYGPETGKAAAQEINFRAVHERQQPGQELKAISAPNANDL